MVRCAAVSGSAWTRRSCRLLGQRYVTIERYQFYPNGTFGYCVVKRTVIPARGKDSVESTPINGSYELDGSQIYFHSASGEGSASFEYMPEYPTNIYLDGKAFRSTNILPGQLCVKPT